jgi:Flp pilus assembly pilin Flp
MERPAPITSSSPPGSSNLDNGPSFLEILAAQREARRAAGETIGVGAFESWDVSPPIETRRSAVINDGNVPDFDLDEEAGSVEARARRLPRGFGQGVVEYSLLLVLIALVVSVVLVTVGHQAQDIFSNLSHGLAT